MKTLGDSSPRVRNKGLLPGSSHLFEQFVQQTQPAALQVPQLAAFERCHRPVELSQHPQALRRDTGFHDASVPPLASTHNQSTILEPIEKPSHVGVSADHALSDFAARPPLPSRAAENAKHVVLRVGKACRLEGLFQLAEQSIGRAHEVEKDLFFQPVETASLFDLGSESPAHRPSIVVQTNTVKRSVSGLLGFLLWADQNLADEAFRRLRHHSRHGVRHVGRLQHLPRVFAGVR